MSVNQVQNSNGTSSFTDSVSSREIFIMRPDQGLDINPQKYVFFCDHFLGDVIADQWSAAQGSDGQGAIAAVVAGEHGGVCRLTTGDAGTGTAADASSLTHGLNWKASQGGLYMQTKLKINTAVTNICLNIGFTDTLATTTLETPFTVSGSTITSAATDAVCLTFDTAQTSDVFNLIGVKNNTDTALTPTTTITAPTADTYAVYGIYIDTSGTASVYINGVYECSVANAVTTSVALTPIVIAEARTTTSKVVDIDYIYVAALV